jgi:hypothetical protein
MGFKMNKPSMAISYGGESVQQQKKNLMTKDPVAEHASGLNNLNKGSQEYGSMAKMNGSPLDLITNPTKPPKKKGKSQGPETEDQSKASGKAATTVSKELLQTNKTATPPPVKKPVDTKASDSAQSAKNTSTRKSGKAVSYNDAYADADKSKYKTLDSFVAAAKGYNKKKYDTTEPTKVAKEKGVTKENLAQNVKKYGPSTSSGSGSGSSSSSSSSSSGSSSSSSSSSSSDASTRKGRKQMKNADKAEGRSRKEVKSLKLQRKAKAASDADPTSRKAARLKKRSDKREKRIKKQG